MNKDMKIGSCQLMFGDCLERMKEIPDASVDIILTDPPYLYLKNQKLDRPFDEEVFFSEVNRVLKKGGFVIMFGRGTSFYRRNTRLADLGFDFKEEIIWNKGYCTSPLMPISRVHETVSIHCKGKGKILKNKVPYFEMKKYDINSVCQDINRLRAILHNPKSLKSVQDFLENNIRDTSGSWRSNNLSISSEITIENRCVGVMRGISVGMNEKDIIKEARDHYTAIHPTQKPVRLLERLLNLVCRDNATVLDPFSGSGSTSVACINTNRKFIGIELDEKYYDNSCKRITDAVNETKHILGTTEDAPEKYKR